MDGDRAGLLERLLNGVSGKVSVIGSMNADYSIRVKHLPHPGETVRGDGIRLTPGGKSANQAVCAATLGADVMMVGVIGRDSNADFLMTSLGKAGVDTRFVRRCDAPTAATLIVVDAAGENTIAYSPGSNDLLTPALVGECARSLCMTSVLGLCLESPLPAVVEGARVCHDHGVEVLLNCSPLSGELPHELVVATDVFLFNEQEFFDCTGLERPHGDDPAHYDWDGLASAAADLGFDRLIVTLGARGSVVVDGSPCVRIDPYQVVPTDTTGCGDAFMGAMLAGLASGYSLAESAEMASAVSAFAATRMGAQPSYGTADEVLGALGMR